MRRLGYFGGAVGLGLPAVKILPLHGARWFGERTVVQMPPWSRDLPWCRWRPCQFCGALELKGEEGAPILHDRCKRFYRRHKWAARADRQPDPYNGYSVLTLLGESD